MDSSSKNKHAMQPKTLAQLLPGLGGILSVDTVDTNTATKQQRPKTLPRTGEKMRPMTLAEIEDGFKGILSVDTVDTNTATKQPRPKRLPRTGEKMRPMTLAEIEDGFKGILSVDTVDTNTATKQQRPKTLPRTGEKMRPMTLAEIEDGFKALSSRRPSQKAVSINKKGWNSLMKSVSKTKNHTSEGQMTHKSVRKVLNFQSKTRTPNPGAIIMNTETSKFPKPGFRAKRSLNIPIKTNVRISGVCNIQETPVTTNKILKNKFTMQHNFNNENISCLSNKNKKKMASPNPIINIIPDTPISNMSFKSCDASFLQKEKEINGVEENMLVEKPILENLADISPPVSTPFKEYRNVKDFFNISNENSVLYDDTIMSFNNDTEHKDKRDESAIVSTVNSSNSTELSVLLDLKTNTENNINLIENAIKKFQNILEGEKKSMQNIIKLINEKSAKKISETENDTTVVTVKETEVKINPQKSPMLRTSGIKMKSQSYKIPKKNLCRPKKIFHKSMSDVANDQKTPEKTDKAINMYMQIKEKMKFLNTPLIKHSNIQAIDTPTATSYNLQLQLDKLYNAS